MFTKDEKKIVGEVGTGVFELIVNFWRGDNLLGCFGLLLVAPVAIPALLVAWLCGGLKKYVGVRVVGETSISLDQFRAMLKKKGLRYVGPFETDADVTHVVCNKPDMVPNIMSEISKNYRWRSAKIVTEQEFWKEMSSR